MLEVIINCSFPIAFESTEKNDLLPEKKGKKNNGIFYYFFLFIYLFQLTFPCTFLETSQP